MVLTIRQNLVFGANGSAAIEASDSTGTLNGRLEIHQDGRIYNSIHQKYILEEDDTGWINFSLLNNVKVGSISKVAQYRRVGKVVYLRGDISSIYKNVTFASLPAGFRPSSHIYIIAAASGIRYTRFTIQPGGNIVLEWASDDNYSLPWYGIDCSFLID